MRLQVNSEALVEQFDKGYASVLNLHSLRGFLGALAPAAAAWRGACPPCADLSSTLSR